MTATIDLVAAVREFIAGLIDATADAPAMLTGREAFHARVAANALAIVERELGGDAAAAEIAALAPFTRADAASELLATTAAAVITNRAAICALLRARAIDAGTPGLVDALIVATCARLAVDNPRYSTLARLAGDAAAKG